MSVDRVRRCILVVVATLGLGACTAPTKPAPGTPAAVRELAPPSAAPLSLIPQVAQLQRQPGAFVVDGRTRLLVMPGDAGARRIAQQFADWLQRSRSLQVPIAEGSAGDHAIAFARDAGVAGEEAYRLDVSPGGVVIRAGSDHGLFYGAVTLWQALTSSPANRVPAMQIVDAPRFAWRGLMLDSVRHFQTTAQIRTLLDQMALHKLNTLHWHLTDDQGWRIQIKRYPELTRIGAWRTPPGAGTDGEPLRYGGFYTQDEIRALVRYAAERYITIVPEIDLPGHAQAALAAYPQFGATGKRPPVSVDWGVNTYLFNVDPPTVHFLENVLDEVMALFPSPYIHLGGDEAVKDQWQASPAVQARMHKLGIKSEDALQGWLLGQLGDYLQRHGRRMVGWDEILEGGAAPADATVMSWRGTKGAIDAARLGHDVILSPAPTLYFDQLQSGREDELTGRVPVESLADIYAFEPVPAELDAAQVRHVIGAQANVWTEHLPTLAHVEHAVFPRLDALAELQWTPRSRRSWPDFLQRLPAQLARYRQAGIAYADSAFAPSIAFDANAALASGSARVTLADQADFGDIHYTLDGSAPTAQSLRYTAPFEVRLPRTVRAITVLPDGTPLAAPRQRVIDRTQLLRRGGSALVNCPASAFRLRVQPMPDATSLQPVYVLSLFDSCQQWPAAPLDGIAAVHVELARLPRNYQLAHEAKLVVQRTATTAHGELLIHRDSCDGPLLARWPLPDPATTPRHFALDAAIAAQQGTHLLCLVSTASTDGPIYVFDHVALRPAGATP